VVGTCQYVGESSACTCYRSPVSYLAVCYSVEFSAPSRQQNASTQDPLSLVKLFDTVKYQKLSVMECKWLERAISRFPILSVLLETASQHSTRSGRRSTTVSMTLGFGTSHRPACSQCVCAWANTTHPSSRQWLVGRSLRRA